MEYRAGTNTLGIISFCLAFGTVLGALGERGRPLVEMFGVVDEVIMRLVMLVMYASPLGIASIIAAKILAVADISVVMSQLGLFIVTAVSGIFLYQLVVLQLERGVLGQVEFLPVVEEASDADMVVGRILRHAVNQGRYSVLS